MTLPVAIGQLRQGESVRRLPRKVELHSLLRYKAWLNIRWRARNNAQDFTRRRLLFQRFLEFLEQPHVFDGDHGLRGKGFKQFCLPVGKWTNLFSTNVDRADGTTLAQHRRYQRTPDSHSDPAGLGIRKIGFRRHEVVYMDCFPVEYSSTQRM